MPWKQLLARKPLGGEPEDGGLRRALGPVALTSLGVGAIIGAGIFVMTGQVAAENAGPAILLSFVAAGFACALAALCYAEFAALAPVAGSAYTYAYTTLGEVFAWVIGWCLVLEYAIAGAVVAVSWSQYFNEWLQIFTGWHVPAEVAADPFTKKEALFNLPAVGIMIAVTIVLVIGIRESAITNTIMVAVKLFVVLFVIAVGAGMVQRANLTGASVPVEDAQLRLAEAAVQRSRQDAAKNGGTPITLDEALKDVREKQSGSWGLFGELGLTRPLERIDESVRSPFMPFGISGVFLGASLVFFAYIGFDSISTHAEEAVRPARDVPIGILTSLAVCTILYMLVAAVIVGMEPYPDIDPDAAVATAFRKKAEATNSPLLKAAAGLIATGALAGMTSVLLVTFLSQARIFLAMARDGLLPQSLFGAVHSRFRTPHRSTILVGAVIAVVSAFTPIKKLEEMVNIGTLLAFTIVCASVLLLRVQRPEIHRPFRCPLVWVVAPLGVVVNLTLMLFLSNFTWAAFAVWLVIGLTIYGLYGHRHSLVGKSLRGGKRAWA
jgi:APA family basic amino acid/polyamine antiporter